MPVRYIGTLQPFSMCRSGTPPGAAPSQGERAAEQEADQIVAPPAFQIGRLLDQHARRGKPGSAEVGAQVGPGAT